MTTPLSREQRIERIVRTLRPTDPGSWRANVLYVTGEFNSYDATLRDERLEALEEVGKRAIQSFSTLMPDDADNGQGYVVVRTLLAVTEAIRARAAAERGK